MQLSNLSPKLHRVSAHKERKSLVKLLSRCSDEEFLRMVWAINMLQTDHETNVKPYFEYPYQSDTPKMNTKYSVHKWELETLINLLFCGKKNLYNILSDQKYKCRNYNDLSLIVNKLRNIENHESGAFLNKDNINLGLHRISHRQFEWHRGFDSYERLYRFIYVYGQGECAEYFKEKYDVTINQFIITGFYLYAQLQKTPNGVAVPIDRLKINEEIIGKVLNIISCNIFEMRAKSRELSKNLHSDTEISLLPSAIRNFPVIVNRLESTYMSPLPQLIMKRITSGLYYDICTGPQRLITEANQRFENYVVQLIQAFMPAFNVLSSKRYGSKKNTFDSPDVLIQSGAEITVVIECKATKLTYAAQYGADPINDATNGYAQLIKGVVQIWKFFSHVRQGIFDEIPLANNTYGVLLTMDSWVQLSADIQRRILLLARERAKTEINIIEEDMKTVIFCSMQELSDLLFITKEEAFLQALESASKERYFGYSILSVLAETKIQREQRDFPFNLKELIPEFDGF